DRLPVELAQRVEAAAERAQVNALADAGQRGEVVRPAGIEVVEDDLPGGVVERLRAGRGAELGVPLRAAPGERLPGRAGGQHPVPITYSPPSAATWPPSPSRPPRRMSVPRPAIWVDTVMAERAPASATIAASSASFLAFRTAQPSPARASRPAIRSDSTMSRVP